MIEKLTPEPERLYLVKREQEEQEEVRAEEIGIYERSVTLVYTVLRGKILKIKSYK